METHIPSYKSIKPDLKCPVTTQEAALGPGRAVYKKPCRLKSIAQNQVKGKDGLNHKVRKEETVKQNGEQEGVGGVKAGGQVTDNMKMLEASLSVWLFCFITLQTVGS